MVRAGLVHLVEAEGSRVGRLQVQNRHIVHLLNIGEPAAAGADDPLIGGAVSDADARHEVAVVGAVEIEVGVRLRHHGGKLAAIGSPRQDVQPQRAPLLVDIVRDLEEVPAQSHIDGQLAGGSPFVLEVGAPAVLTRRGPDQAFGAGRAESDNPSANRPDCNRRDSSRGCRAARWPRPDPARSEDTRSRS